jgi:hypothetical protein
MSRCAPNASSFQLGHVEDKRWVAVNVDPLSPYCDHVYALWSVFNNNTTKIRIAVSRDRGLTFSKAVTITAPAQTGPSNTYIYPSVDAAGDLYVAFTSFPLNANQAPPTIYVSRSTDDGQTFAPFVAAVRNVGVLPATDLPNTLFRDGITENFVASPTYPGHLYLTYEDWDGTQMDVKFTQSTDGGFTWSTPVVVNDAANSATTDQFQPSVAGGPERGGRGRLLRPPPGLPKRQEHAQGGRRPDELLHRHLTPGLQGHGHGSGCSRRRRQRAHLAVHLGSQPATAARRRDRPVSMRSPSGSLHD